MSVTTTTRPSASMSQFFSRALITALVLATASVALSAQNITVSPATLKFSKTVVDITSASKSVTVSNTGASSQAVAFVMSGDFSETDNCNGSIAGGGSCTLKVSFTPTQAGAISGAASIYDNNHNLLALVGLTGSGAAPVSTAPASLSFGSVPIGTLSSAKTFKITNGNPTAVTITSISPSSDYVVNTGTCLSGALNPKASCTVSVQVQPTQATANGAIVITDNASNGTPLAVALSASGTGSSNSPLSLSKTSLTFKKTVAGGTSPSQSVTVTNTSGSAVTMGAITASSDYSETNTCPASGSTLGAGQLHRRD